MGVPLTLGLGLADWVPAGDALWWIDELGDGLPAELEVSGAGLVGSFVSEGAMSLGEPSRSAKRRSSIANWLLEAHNESAPNRHAADTAVTNG